MSSLYVIPSSTFGCGFNSPLREIPADYKVGVDLFDPYIEESRSKGIHDDYVKADILEIEFAESSFDAVIATEVLEHLEKDEGYKLIDKMERWASKKIFLTTPNGFLSQEEYHDNPRQVHKSGWAVKDFEKLGFTVKGLNGWKPLRGEKAVPTVKPKLLGKMISDISQKIVYNKPEHAFQLMVVKEIE